MKRNTLKLMIVMLGCVGLVFGGIFGFQVFKAHMAEKYMSSMKMPPVTVSALRVEYQDWQPQAQAAGTLRAVNGVDVTSEIAGLVHAIYFKPGAIVKAGDLLLELNAQADTAQRDALQAAADAAQTIVNRDKAQYAIKAVSKATLDADSADLKNKQAQLAQQVAILAQKSIRAPFGGHLGVSAVNLGQYLNPGDKIVTLQALDPIYVDFFMPQQTLLHLAPGQAVTLTTDTYPGRSFSGTITTINPKVDVATRNVQVEATVSNSEGELLPGMFAAVQVITGEPQRYLTLPQTAVSFNPYGEVVFVVNESGKDAQGKPTLTVTQTFISSGDKRGDQVAILKGLKEGDQVVTSGQLKLKNGSEVIINNQVMPSNEANPKLEEE